VSELLNSILWHLFLKNKFKDLEKGFKSFKSFGQNLLIFLNLQELNRISNSHESGAAYFIFPRAESKALSKALFIIEQPLKIKKEIAINGTILKIFLLNIFDFTFKYFR
jgi:hypothetical protein